MSDDYLWDKRHRPVDPFVVELERALAGKRYDPRPVAAVAVGVAAVEEERLAWPAIAVGSLLALAAAAILVFALWTAPTGDAYDGRPPANGPIAGGTGAAPVVARPDSEVDVDPVVRRNGDPVTK